MGSTSLSLAIALLGGLIGGQSLSAEQLPADWARADSLVVRLPPSAFPMLSAPMKAALERRGCTIPQAFEDKAPHNVARGRFLKSGRADWAVLCSCQRVSRILIIRGDTGAVVDSLAESPDVESLQVVGDGRAAYSRAIETAPAKRIRAYLKRSGPDTIAGQPITHDGIEDMFLEKASQVYYLGNGRWWTIAGSD